MRSVAWLDLTADGARCWLRTADTPSRAVLLEPGRDDLKLALRLEGRRLALGHAAWAQRRLHPHLVATGFLGSFGDAAAQWKLGRRRLTARDAVKMALQVVKERLGHVRRLLVSLPGGWTAAQAQALRELLVEVGFEPLGLLARDLLFGLESSSGEAAWRHDGLVLGVDEATFTVAALRPSGTDLKLLGVASRPHLGRFAWRQRLIDAVAQKCVAVERRDPRAVPEAEQLLFDQSEGWFAPLAEGDEIKAEAFLSHRALPFHLTLTAREAAQACRDLTEAVAELALGLLQRTIRPAAGGALFLSPEAAALPGLAGHLFVKSGQLFPVTTLGTNLAATALSLAESVAEKERPPLEFAARGVEFPAAEFTFDAPATLTFPGEARPRAAGQ